MQQQSTQAFQFQQALLQMQQLQTQLCQQVSAGNNNTVNAIRAMGCDRPTQTLSIPQWTPNNKLEWIR
eukprot:9253809-Ditylum_brightwellii.AAC.1